jgi:hypothetical protein
MHKFGRLATTVSVALSFVFAAVAAPAQSASRSVRPNASQSALFRDPTEKFYDSGGFAATSVAVGDVNRDGIPDIVVTNCGNLASEACPSEGAVGVLLGNGDGTFEAAVSYDSGGDYPKSVAIADVNGDGIPDLVVANYEGASGSPEGEGVIGVLLGNGDGTFQTAVTFDPGGIQTNSVAVADVNGDGKPDMVVAENVSGVPCCSPSYVGVLLGNGNGTFQPAQIYSAGGYVGASVAVADVNGDGIPDVLLASYCLTLNNDTCATSDGTIGVLLGVGNGTFQPVVNYDAGGRFTDSVITADMNGDGIPDIVVANDLCQSNTTEAGAVAVLLGNGNGTFQSALIDVTPLKSPLWVSVADFNGDGILDVLFAPDSGGMETTEILLGNGDGTFESSLLEYGFGIYGTGVSVAAADVNGDGRPDIVVANQCFNKEQCTKTFPESSVGVLLNEYRAATTMTLTASPNPSQVGQSVTFTATITSASAVPNGATVTFSHGATTLGTGTTTNGVATFSTSFTKAGSEIIKAAYTGNPFHEKSSSKVTETVQSAP